MKPILLQLCNVINVRRILLWLVLGAYAIAMVPEDSLHQLFHSEEFAALHSVKNESDPCHLRLYHQVPESACNHDSHVVKDDNCNCHHFFTSKQHTATTVYIFSSSPIYKTFISTLKLQYPEASLAYCSSRAPPSA